MEASLLAQKESCSQKDLLLMGSCPYMETAQGEITATTVHSHGSVFQSSNVSFLEGQFWGDTSVKGSKISSSKVYQVNVIL